MRLAPTLLIFAAMASVALAQSSKKPPTNFLAFLSKMDAAQVQLQNGEAKSYKLLWSTADGVTITGGFGGGIEKGWEAVSKRLDWAASQFSNGTNSIERLVVSAEGNLGYVVQLEHIKFKVPATGADASRDYRVTMVFRRERGGWKIIHRHADSQTSRQPA